MSNSEKCALPQASSSKSGDTSTAITGTAGQPIEAFIAPIVTVQLAFVELMIDCTLALVKEPASQSAAGSPQVDSGQQKISSGSGTADCIEAATPFGAGWFEAPMITGIEETLNDQFFQPRPRYVQERDILILKDPGNNFEASHAPAETQASKIHSEAA